MKNQKINYVPPFFVDDEEEEDGEVEVQKHAPNISEGSEVESESEDESDLEQSFINEDDEELSSNPEERFPEVSGYGEDAEEESEEVEPEEAAVEKNIYEDENEDEGEGDAEEEIAPAIESSVDEENIVVPKNKIILAGKLLENIKENQEKLSQLLSPYFIHGITNERLSISQVGEIKLTTKETEEGTVLEGIFNGEVMIGPDGKEYSIPANYASKSKLVEGDLMKLTITPNGTFIYKQIGPVERSRVIGVLMQDKDGSYFVSANNQKWNILTASVTYYKGQTNDEVIILVPKGAQSSWAAVENIVKKS
jgi:hypothetical protein